MWRLELKTTLTLLPRAYIRTLDRFVTSMHQLVPTRTDEKLIHFVSFFNAGGNTAVRSLLRVINPNPFAVYVTCRGWDDAGNPGESAVEFSIQAQSAVLISAKEIEDGSPNFTGRFGDGDGKWRIWVTSNAALQVMSCLPRIPATSPMCHSNSVR